AAVPIGRVHRPAHTVLVIPHVAISHADGVDIWVEEARIPRHRVGDTVDVVPTPGIETDKVTAERRADLHQLKGRFDLLYQDVGLDNSYRQVKVLLERREQVVPKGRVLSGLDLRQVED